MGMHGLPSTATGSLLAVALGTFLGWCGLGCAATDRPGPGPADETTLREIPLEGDAQSSSAEISGLAWHGTLLILLPQYPSRFPVDDAPGSLFSIERAEIEDWYEGRLETVSPGRIAFDPSAVASIPGYEGFEAIAFDGDRAYLTIEAGGPEGARGYLVGALLDVASRRLTLEGAPVEIPPAALLGNFAYEALVVSERGVLALHEVSSRRVNPEVAGRLFSPELEPLPDVAVPEVEYRITDATAPDEAGQLWVVNYQFSGDATLLPPGQEPLAVERILLLAWGEAGLAATDRVVDLGATGEGRNWEGIARFGDGSFLIATDRHPRTILALVSSARSGR